MRSMGTLERPNSAAETGSERTLKAASLLLCSTLAGCGSSWGNSPPSASLPPPNTPAVSQTAVPGTLAPTPAMEMVAESDGVHPNQTITDWFRRSPPPGPAPAPGSAPGPAPASANAANVPHPPSSYTPSGQPYTPPAQQAYGEPQDSSDADSDGVHPSQSISDLFRR